MDGPQKAKNVFGDINSYVIGVYCVGAAAARSLVLIEDNEVAHSDYRHKRIVLNREKRDIELRLAALIMPMRHVQVLQRDCGIECNCGKR